MDSSERNLIEDFERLSRAIMDRMPSPIILGVDEKANG
jgi:hypothetical protein